MQLSYRLTKSKLNLTTLQAGSMLTIHFRQYKPTAFFCKNV